MVLTRDFVSKANDSGICLAVFVTGQIFETEAWTFLNFSKEDLDESSMRGRVNALTNAKRAVANRVDTLLYIFCLNSHAKREKWNYPTKAAKLRLAGITVPDILQDLITTPRNDLEHEYKLPKTSKEVSNCVDLAGLFLQATDPAITRGQLRWIVGPTELQAGYDILSLRPSQLPQNAYGFLIDREQKSFRVTLNGHSSESKASDINSDDLAESLRIIHAAIVPDSTIILGPMSEPSFRSSYG